MRPARDPDRPSGRTTNGRRPGARRGGVRRGGIRRGALTRPSGAPEPQDLQHLLKMIASSTDARRELVEDIRSQIASGKYMTEEKLNIAIYRLLKDILK